MSENPFKPFRDPRQARGLPPAMEGQADLPLPQAPASLPLSRICKIVSHIVSEFVMLTGERVQMRRDRRRVICHIRQIAMYICHVTLSIPLNDIASAYGKDRSTVGHACGVVEDRRDNAAYDEFVTTIERLIKTIFGQMEPIAYD